MKSMIWLTFDLGVRGDYEGMYRFLDNIEARECGDSAAVFNFEYHSDLIAELSKAIHTSVELDGKSRIYVAVPEGGTFHGRFIIGKRKRPPWTGYGSNGIVEEDSGA